MEDCLQIMMKTTLKDYWIKGVKAIFRILITTIIELTNNLQKLQITLSKKSIIMWQNIN